MADVCPSCKSTDTRASLDVPANTCNACGAVFQTRKRDDDNSWYYVDGVRYCALCRTRRCDRQPGGSLRCALESAIPIDALSTAFAEVYGFGEGTAPVRFETMFSVEGWIVGWVCEGPEHNTRIDQSPALRVELGYLLQVRMPATGLIAVVALDNSSRYWPTRLRRMP